MCAPGICIAFSKLSSVGTEPPFARRIGRQGDDLRESGRRPVKRSGHAVWHRERSLSTAAREFVDAAAEASGS
jgi:hypothetical protein